MTCDLSWTGPLLALLLLGASAPLTAPAGGTRAAPSTPVPGGAGIQASPPDSSKLRSEAREAQARFEYRRRRSLPSRWGRGRGACGEVIGRFCIIYDGEDDWMPSPDPPEVLQARQDLLETLTRIGEAIPGDRWVLAQRVYYLGEEGRWSEARELTRGCGGHGDDWWCHALRGFVHHGAERYPAALDAFRAAMERMDRERAQRWRKVEPVLDDDALDVWRDAAQGVRPALRRRLWTLADPLYLVEGNDRLTAHYFRHTVSWIREDAANPHRVSWGRDLAEILVRYGAELGWEKERPRVSSLEPDHVVGHHHPESRQYLPPGPAFGSPATLESGEWQLDADRPRSAYAPPYAARMGGRPFQVAGFRRDDDLVVVAGFRLPPDTTGDTVTRGRGPPGPWGGTLQAGLFVVDPDSGVVGERRVRDRRSGALLVRVGAGAYLVSVEVWDPGTTRAGRSRQGVAASELPADVAALSDLLLMDPGDGLPRDLVRAARRARPEPVACPGERLPVAWELYGLGLRRETAAFRLRLQRADGNVLRRAAEWLGLMGSDEPVALEWTEPGPDRLLPFFRAVELGLPPDLEAGRYELTLDVRLEGRTPLVSTRQVDVGGELCRGRGRPPRLWRRRGRPVR